MNQPTALVLVSSLTKQDCRLGLSKDVLVVHAGKTQHINHFIINNTWYLVDLPGYG